MCFRVGIFWAQSRGHTLQDSVICNLLQICLCDKLNEETYLAYIRLRLVDNEVDDSEVWSWRLRSWIWRLRLVRRTRNWFGTTTVIDQQRPQDDGFIPPLLSGLPCDLRITVQGEGEAYPNNWDKTKCFLTSTWKVSSVYLANYPTGLRKIQGRKFQSPLTTEQVWKEGLGDN